MRFRLVFYIFDNPCFPADWALYSSVALLLGRTARRAARVAIVAAAMVIGAFAALFAADFEAGEVVTVQETGFCLRRQPDLAARSRVIGIIRLRSVEITTIFRLRSVEISVVPLRFHVF